MDQVISVQISFLPLDDQKINLSVNNVLEIIEKSGLRYRVGLLSTEVTGNKDRVMGLINEIVDYSVEHSKFVIDVKISNICGK
ncbi:MAG: thiamine-binding protein [Bacillota bacterium]|nr:thiamine-binding protein [Bacillota bacterium]